MTQMLQISEDDLAELERIVPSFADALFTQMDGALRAKFRVVQRVLSDVRWRYGPPAHVERANDEDSAGDRYCDS